MTITDQNLSVSVWNAVRAKIIASAPYITNGTTDATTVAEVLAKYNDKKPTRPQITIAPIAKSESEFKFSGTSGKKFINIFVDAYAETSLGTDQLRDQIDYALSLNDIKGIDLVAISSDPGFVNPNQVKYHVMNMVFTYIRE